VLVYFKPFRPGLILVSKAGAYPNLGHAETAWMGQTL